ncbi:hypothetical protein ACIPY6_34715 [Streptomyces sp. NPDC090054]|uniref:hypothetical protein n=1 Tax=Streptomyces sp. NPDC090054 TaxID=3365933 RepID=UPI003823C92D
MRKQLITASMAALLAFGGLAAAPSSIAAPTASPGTTHTSLEATSHVVVLDAAAPSPCKRSCP